MERRHVENTCDSDRMPSTFFDVLSVFMTSTVDKMDGKDSSRLNFGILVEETIIPEDDGRASLLWTLSVF
jgi:hypothetical protein